MNSIDLKMTIVIINKARIIIIRGNEI